MNSQNTTATHSDYMNTEAPIRGAEYDKNRPETREAWLDQRRGGITATEIRDWHDPSKRRKIIGEKVNGDYSDIGHVAAVRHGELREPVIAEWVHGKFGIAPCDYVYSRAGEPRHLASPDGISLDPFTGELLVGNIDAALSEIKCSKNDLNPGKIDDLNILIEIEPGSYFDKTNYYTQMQWQMYVMNASRTLFVWEQRDETIDPETGTFTPLGVPKWAWIMRDDALIEKLVEQVAPKALAEIDAQRAAIASGMPPVSDADPEIAALVAELLQARTAEATAKSAKEIAWAKLQEKYLTVAEGAEHPEDVSLDLGFAQITVNTTTKAKMVTDVEAAGKRAPGIVQKYNDLMKRFTKPVDTTSTSFTVTAKKEQS